MYCMFQENECLTLPDPTDPWNNATCRKPEHFVVDGVDQTLMEGTWYVVNGYNPQYDCFGCQELSFDFHGEEATDYNALYNLIAVNGSMIWNDIKMKGYEETPGIITMKGRDSGFENI